MANNVIIKSIFQKGLCRFVLPALLILVSFTKIHAQTADSSASVDDIEFTEIKTDAPAAVDTVAKRLQILVDDYGKDTPSKMVIWKCGGSCAATGGQAAANKWISDVNIYFKQLNEEN